MLVINKVCVLKRVRTPACPGKPVFDCVGFDVDYNIRESTLQHSIDDILKTHFLGKAIDTALHCFKATP